MVNIPAADTRLYKLETPQMNVNIGLPIPGIGFVIEDEVRIPEKVIKKMEENYLSIRESLVLGLSVQKGQIYLLERGIIHMTKEESPFQGSIVTLHHR